MKARDTWPTWASCLALALVGCSKAPPSATVAPEAGPGADGSAAPELSARVVITGAPIGQEQAQTMAMQFAAKRWPQYHPRFAVALREPKDWKVLVQFQEPGVGGMVTYDLTGNLLDAGTSTGEH